MSYLQNHEILASRDLHEMQVLLADLTNTDKVDLVGAGHEVAASLKHASFGGLDLFHVTYGQVPTRIHAFERDEDGVMLFVLTEGRADVRHGGVDIAVSSKKGLVRESRMGLTAFQDRFSSFVIPIANSALQRHARTLYGEEAGRRGITLQREMDFTTPGGQQFCSTVHYIASSLDGPLLGNANALVLQGLQDIFLTHVLTLLPNSNMHLAATTPAKSAVLPYHVKRARDFIHAHADNAITLEQLATQAGCGYRTLQIAFNAAFGMAPMAYLRHIRLNRAHQELCAAEDDVAIRDIALRWGFAHLGGFSRAYQKEFGVLPSHTRRRRR